MSNILIKTVRIKGFRGLKNIEVDLEPTTVLTGMNNAGKTSFLKALQIVFGNRQFITQDDFLIENGESVEKIIIDTLIFSSDNGGNFSEEWEQLFTFERIKDDEIKSFIPLRTIVTFDALKSYYNTKQYILDDWSSFQNGEDYWYNSPNGNEKPFRFDEMPFFYMDAQRDILEDLKSKRSYLGKMLSKIEYSFKYRGDSIMNLSEKQEEIVYADDGAIYVEASAGSGKTRVITQRVKYLLGKTKKQILALTFTNKAGQEIKDRLKESNIENVDERLFVGTFHSFCQYVLEYHGSAIGLSPMPHIFEESKDRLELIAQAIEQVPLYWEKYNSYNEKEQNSFKYRALDFISKVKRELISDSEYNEHTEDENIIILYRSYQDLLRVQNAIDFDDLPKLSVKPLASAMGI